MTDLTRERKARGRALHMGLGLHKSRVDGSWYITDSYTSGLVFPASYTSANPFAGGATLEEVEEYLADERIRRI